jgi:hypothetical protein
MTFVITAGFPDAIGAPILVSRMPLYGVERAMGVDDRLPDSRKPVVNFRLYDDDGELMYEGFCDDDDECENQSAALRWGETMAGCTRIDVKRDDKWIGEIG